MKKIFLLSLLALGLLAGCAGNSAPEEGNGSIVPIDEITYDWGDISIEDGPVSHGFSFKNDGTGDLILKGLTTSCMCTEAVVELSNGDTSPAFGMHNNQEWSASIAPGETFEVQVTFDPMAHGPDGVGALQRAVWLASDDVAGTVEMRLTTNVMYEADYETEYGDQDFILKETEYDFGVVKQSGGIVSREFEFTYKGDESIVVTGVPTSCSCTTAEISQTELAPGDIGTITVYFDPNLHEEPEGKFFKTISLLTEPSLENTPELKIWAEIDLDLGPEAYTLGEHTD